MSSPSRVTTPSCLADGTSSCMRLNERSRVDLPQPDGPMMAVTRLASIGIWMPSSTLWSPKYSDRSLAWSLVATAAALLDVGTAPDQARRQAQEQDEGDQDEAGRPGQLPGPGGELGGVLVDVQGQRHDRPVRGGDQEVRPER